MTLARKKREEAPAGNAPWINTFADLMNLLLCFFVLLFSMSSVDARKFEEITWSLSKNIGIFSGGQTAITEGKLLSSGISQLNDLSEYFTSMGQNSSQADGKEQSDSTSTDSKSEQDTTDVGVLNKAKDILQGKMEEETKNLYNKISDLTANNNLESYVELSMDAGYQYVQITLRGSFLFDSGQAEIKEDAKPVLSRIGDILKRYDGYHIEIEGHTDNQPIKSSQYKDNNWLSSARALNAADYLITAKKLDPQMIKYSGRGEYEPIASNETSDGRALNRRIEIKLYNEFSDYK